MVVPLYKDFLQGSRYPFPMAFTHTHTHTLKMVSILKTQDVAWG